MKLNEKETQLLTELQEQEMHCIQKYDFYVLQAKSQELKKLFGELKRNEEHHYKMVCKMLAGEVPDYQYGQDMKNFKAKEFNYTDDKAKEFDKYLCTDSIITEKYVATDYNSDLFFFASPEVRKLLNTIMTEEQKHAEMVWDYKVANKMVA